MRPDPTMRRRCATTMLLLAALTGGCGTIPEQIPVRPVRHAAPVRVQQAQVDAVLRSAAEQVRRCYRAPRVSSAGRLIVTRVRVRLTPEGELAGLPTLLFQRGVTAANRSHAAPMAEAAISAVMRCAPLHLDPELYAGGWREFDLTFSPLAAA
jgi:hypothetical protein